MLQNVGTLFSYHCVLKLSSLTLHFVLLFTSLSKHPVRQRVTLVRIARIAVRLLLLGLYKTAVESSIQILTCENIDGKVSVVLRTLATVLLPVDMSASAVSHMYNSCLFFHLFCFDRCYGEIPFRALLTLPLEQEI